MKCKLLLMSLVALIAFGVKAAGKSVEKFETPRMTVYLPDAGIANGKAVIILPGGGYSFLATDNEGNDWVPFFNDQGIAAIVLEYTLPDGDPSKPLADVDAAFRIVKENAGKWHINPSKIGIMGSSAGGHLASTVATHPTKDATPAFQILFYPAISLELSLTHEGTRHGFAGKMPSRELIEEYSSDKRVKPTTSQAFIVVCGDDDIVNPANSLLYCNALLEAGVPTELLYFPDGLHGFGAKGNLRHRPVLMSALTAWLAHI